MGVLTGSPQGYWNAATGIATNFWALGSSLLNNPADTTSQIANGLLLSMASPDRLFNSYRDNKNDVEILASLYELQGNTAASAAVRAKYDAEMAINLVPVGRIGKLGEAATEWGFIGPIPRSPSEIASSWQGKAPYIGVDKYTDTTIREGTLVVGAAPGQSPYYTTMNGFESTGGTAVGYYDGLQIKRNFDNSAYPPYRNGVTIYKVSSDVLVGAGTTLANPQFGVGGVGQMFIPNFENVLIPLYSIPFKR